MSELKLADAEEIQVASFYDGQSKQTRDGKLDVCRWTKYGNDRLYINAGVSKCDKYSLYVDLETHEICSDNDGKHKGGSVEIDGDTAEITIVESGIEDKEHIITVSLEGDEFKAVPEPRSLDEDAESVMTERHECEHCEERFERMVYDDDERDDAAVATDGGTELPISDTDIEDAIQRHDDPDHPDALTVADVRDLLAVLQRDAADHLWGEWMESIEAGDAQVIADTGDALVLATGERAMYDEGLAETPSELPVKYDDVAANVVSAAIHNAAERLTDRNWGYDHPMILVKPEGADAGEEYVTAVVNGLLRRGLSPGQAWAYYGVEIRDRSRNAWASRCGYSDHSAVSEPLRKAKRKLDV